jgi:hypothetical protein
MVASQAGFAFGPKRDITAWASLLRQADVLIELDKLCYTQKGLSRQW